MISRIVALIVLGWMLGLAWFIVSLPGPAGEQNTDAIVVLTGAKGRIERGLVELQKGRAKRMLVSGVFPLVSKTELAVVQNAPRRLFTCCIDLGKEAVNTRTNADETAAWLKSNKFKSVRLITTDWHMPRARFELELQIPSDVVIISDGVKSTAGLAILITEYNKLLARRVSALFGY